MRTSVVNIRRPLIVFIVVLLGVMGLTANPVAAAELCANPADRQLLFLFDPTDDDGVLTIDDLEYIVTIAPAGPTLDQFQQRLTSATNAGVTGIRYDGTGACAAATATTAPAATTVPPTATRVPPTATTVPPTATRVPPRPRFRPPRPPSRRPFPPPSRRQRPSEP